VAVGGGSRGVEAAFDLGSFEVGSVLVMLQIASSRISALMIGWARSWWGLAVRMKSQTLIG